MQDQGKPNQRRSLPLSRILPARWRRRGAQDETPPEQEQPEASSSDLLQSIGELIATVPPSRENEVADPAHAVQRLARETAHRAALLSGSLALPPGPLGVLTIVPDLFLIWKMQRQMVADIFALYGRTAELTHGNMVYCLFRHLASHVVRDVAVRAAQRALLSSAAQGTATALGMHLTRRIAGAAAGRWVPIVGAAAVGAYAYWDTLQVARAAQRVLAGADTPPALPHLDVTPQPS